jgi:uncharacterized protein
MKGYHLFTAPSGNRYCFHPRRGTLLWCSPLFYHVIGLHRSGRSVDAWFASLRGDHLRVDGVTFSRRDAERARRRYQLLRQDGFFDETSTDEVARALSARLDAGDVERHLANTPQVVFELTERCNLSCDYCYFGDHYVQNEPRGDRDLDFGVARTFLEYLACLSAAQPGGRVDHEIRVGFFGGEPLLPFPLLRSVVRNARRVFGERARFEIVTNGMLLPQRWDFLVQHDFEVLVSLDGDESCNTHRRTADGRSTHRRIYGNLQALRRRYPSYFERRVSLNAILASGRSPTWVREYFRREFDKEPRLNSLVTRNLKDPESASGFAGWDQDVLVEVSMPRMARHFARQNAPCRFRTYREALGRPSAMRPTGVCLPFENRVFVTAKGVILPCEQVDRRHALGRVNAQTVDIDFAGIAATYNDLFERASGVCSRCPRAFDCSQCLFMLDLDGSPPRCRGAPSEAEYCRQMEEVLDYLERNEELVLRALQDGESADLTQ